MKGVEMKFVRIDPHLNAASASWQGLIDFAEVLPHGWSLAGGQMVYVHTQYHEVDLARPSSVVDVVVDIRANPGAARNAVEALRQVGFQPTKPDAKNRVHPTQRA